MGETVTPEVNLMLSRSTISSIRTRAHNRLGAALVALVLVGCGNNSTGTDTGGGNEPGPGTGTGTGSGQATLTINGAANNLVLQSCGVAAARVQLAAGSYSITLKASTLSKGYVTSPGAVKSSDNYVLVYLPLPAGDKNEGHRFFMLNGVGSSYNFSLPSAGGVQTMFVDSDQDSNNGEATVEVQPGNNVLKVDAAVNVLRWKQGCNSRPVDTDLDAGKYQFKLTKSSLSAGSGSHDDFVIIRTPSEDPNADSRYVVVNGVNGATEVSFNTAGTLHAWALGVQTPPGGSATLSIYKR